jgi:hypothetical protein
VGRRTRKALGIKRSGNSGQRCWEADILHAAVIENALDRHIRNWLNVTQWKRRIAEIERTRKLL